MRRRLFIASVLGFWFFFCASSVAANGPSAHAYYTDIPGVTPEEAQAIERLKRSRPQGLTYVMIQSDSSFIDMNGEIGGVTRIFCEELSRLFGIAVTPRLAEWDTLISGLNNYNFDMSGELTATPQRREKYRMSSPMMERVFTVFRNKDREALDLINSKETLRYGFLKDSVISDRVRDTSAVPFVAVFVDNIQEATEAIHSGAIDAFISEGRMDSLFERYSGIIYQEYYPLLYTTVSLATANPDIFPIIDVFQKYLDTGGRRRVSEMHTEGEVEYLRHKFLRQLSAEEKKYLAERLATGKPIPLAAEHDNYPVSFYNRQERRWQGIAHDILAEITRATGLEFKIDNPPDMPWLSLRETLENGGAAMVTELMPTRNRRGRFLWPQAPYMTDCYALLSLTSTPNITIHQIFGSKVGLIHGSAHAEAFFQVFPDHSNTVNYATTMEAFEALENGDVDLVMMTKNLLLGVTHYSERPDFKVNFPLNIPSDSYFGFNLNESLLCGIIDKAQAIVDCAAITEQWQRKTFDSDKRLAQARIPYLISIFALLLLVLTLLLALSRRRERRSTRLIGLDHLTRLPNRRHFDERMRAEWNKAVKERLSLSLLAIDIDNFKRLNDTYGHPQGDAVLRSVAQVFKSVMERNDDMVARTGGEEFSVLLPNTDKEGARVVAEKIRAAVAAAAMENIQGGPPLAVTISIGVAGLKPGPTDSVENITVQSDHALYAAKQDGRNRVCVA